LALVPEGRQVFGRLTTEENLEMGAYARRDQGIKADLQRIYRLFPRLHERRRQTAGTLSGGQPQMLATARAPVRATHLPPPSRPPPAEHWPRAAHGAAYFPDDPESGCRGRHRPAGGAKREAGAGGE